MNECSLKLILVQAATVFNFTFSGDYSALFFRYAGILMGITNTFATIPGFASPAVVTYITSKHVSLILYFFGRFGLHLFESTTRGQQSFLFGLESNPCLLKDIYL